MDQIRRDADLKLRDLDPYYQRAFAMLTGRSAASAFDIAAEDPKLRDRYGRHTFGQSVRLASRPPPWSRRALLPDGRPVSWDHHDRPAAQDRGGAKKLIPPHGGIAALVDDLIDRGR